MALISIAEAAAQAGISEQDIEAWANRGLLEIHTKAETRAVDADQFHDVIETLGWLQVSSQNWDDAEDD